MSYFSSSPYVGPATAHRNRQALYRKAWQYGSRIFTPSMAMYGAPAAAAAVGYARKNGKNSIRSLTSASKGGAAPLAGRKQKSKRKSKYCKGIKGKASKEICKLKNQMKDIKLSENASLGLKTFRGYESFTQKTSGINITNPTPYDGNSVPLMEAAIVSMKQLDSSTNTIVTNNFNTGTFQRKVLFKSVTSQLVIRNNYQTDCDVKVYLCIPKSDTIHTPTSAWSQGISDQASGVSSTGTLYQYPTDYQLFNDLFRTKVLLNKSLNPGETTKCSHSVNNIEFDPATIDVESENYQPRWKSFQWLVIVQPTLGHDVTNAGHLQCGVDVLSKYIAKISYDAGANLNTIEISDQQTALVDSRAQSQKAANAQQNYLV